MHHACVHNLGHKAWVLMVTIRQALACGYKTDGIYVHVWDESIYVHAWSSLCVHIRACVIAPMCAYTRGHDCAYVCLRRGHDRAYVRIHAWA
jgi:hypothetical protein